MVFLRYFKVLRKASNTFRYNVLAAKHNPEITLDQRNIRACKIHTNDQSEISPNSEASTVFHENIPTVKPNILGFTSPVATVNESNISETNEADNEICNPDNIDTDELFESVKIPGALDTCDNDISHVVPFHQPSFNFAAYANDSATIQELTKLGVELYKLERRDKAMRILLQRSFEEMMPHIQFLHDCGIPADSIGAFITKNPYIFTQTLDDLHTRIRYLRAHNFNRQMITRIVSYNPYWLMFSTKRIDMRLGHFQREFELKGHEVRALATKQPKLITYAMRSITENTFGFREEMGFNKIETKSILLAKPKLFMKSRKKLVNLFDYIHNTMKLSHKILYKQPKILYCRMERLRNRHEYLEALGKNQYDPTKPMYVSPEAIVTGTDLDFCRDVAKTSVETYNLYLKTR